MRILIIDYYNATFSLQQSLLKKGHTLYIHFQLHTSRCLKKLITEDNIGHCKLLGLSNDRLIISNGKDGLEKAVKECDFIINYNSIAGPLTRIDKILHQLAVKYNKNIVNEQFFNGHIELEYDRYLAKSIDFGFDKYETHKIFNYEEYKAIKSKKRFVIKAVNEKSNKIKSEFRTIIPQSKSEEDIILKEDRYNHFASGGVVLEEYINGDEICLGMYWDGSKVVGNVVFVNQEYKGVWDNDLSGILCGECGSCFYATYINNLPTRCRIIISKLTEYLKIHNSNYRGFVDMNAIIKGKNIYLLEFTVRSGFPTEPCLLYIIKDYDEFMYSVATGTKFNGKIIINKRVVAVSMFGYGIPIIPNVVKKPVVITGDIFNKNIVLTSIYKVLNKNLIETKCLENPVICIAEGYNSEQARSKVYSTLKKINSYGLVYRSDIGTLFENALTKLNNLG